MEPSTSLSWSNEKHNTEGFEARTLGSVEVILMTARKIKIAVAMVAVAVSFVSAKPAMADGGVLGDLISGTLNVAGDILDTTGRVIGHLTFGTGDRDRTRVVYAPSGPNVVALPSTVVTRPLVVAQPSFVTAPAVVATPVVRSYAMTVPSTTTSTMVTTRALTIPSSNLIVRKETYAVPAPSVALTPGISTMALTVPTTSPAITSYRMTMPEALSVIISNRMTDFQRRLALLPSSESIVIRSELDRIANAEAAARASGGVLTFDEAMSVAAALDALNPRVATYSTSMSPLVVVDPSTGVRSFAITNMHLY